MVRIMSGCECNSDKADTVAEQSALKIAFTLNIIMFVVETTAGLFGHSSGLLADGLDMLADAAAYAVALFAVGRSVAFKVRAARLSGWALLVLGVAVLFDVARRVMSGAEPEGEFMVVVAAIALGVNWIVLRQLGRFRDGEVHMKAAWIFTRADVVANATVILSGVLVMVTGQRWLDLAVGCGIGLYVIREAFEILGEAREPHDPA